MPLLSLRAFVTHRKGETYLPLEFTDTITVLFCTESPPRAEISTTLTYRHSPNWAEKNRKNNIF
jgi:hypothetical protein